MAAAYVVAKRRRQRMERGKRQRELARREQERQREIAWGEEQARAAREAVVARGGGGL